MIGFLQKEFQAFHLNISDYGDFVESIPFNIYSILYDAIWIKTCVKNKSLFGEPNRESVEVSIKKENTQTYKNSVDSLS